MTKLLWHSNSPLVATGYGNQTALFLPSLAEMYDTACSAFYGIEGSPIRWEDIPILPGLGGDYGDSTLPQHALRWFGGDLRGGLVVTLMDVWVLNPTQMRQMNVASWCPVDHEPAPPGVVDYFVQSDAVPIAMSRFGQQQLGRLDPLYIPHAVDCQTLKPMDRQRARGQSFPEGAFVVGMVAANKGRPSRKGFAQALSAFARFAAEHEKAFLYLHTVLDPNYGQGENLKALIEALAIPPERVRIADQYTMLHSPYSTGDMARVYAAMDVLLNPSWGEGFGIPVIEAAAVGVPAIVTDFSAMREVCGAGWHVSHQPYWTNLGSWQAIPDIDDIRSALEECYSLSAIQREKLAVTARQHAEGYDVRRVLKQWMLPALRTAWKRFEARRPVTVAPRRQVAA